VTDLVFSLVEGRAPRTAVIRERMEAPLPRGLKQAIADRAIRKGGPGSIEDQFRRQAEMGRLSSAPWLRTQDFGSRKAPARTLHRSGALEAAWTGGPGSVTLVDEPHTIGVGVDSKRFPQAAMFQRNGITVIPITRRMRMFVGMTFGVWFKASKQRILVQGRPVAINREILSRARPMVQGYFLRGQVAA
jgi:hypothetical protein